jgi:hypothetical protein
LMGPGMVTQRETLHCGKADDGFEGEKLEWMTKFVNGCRI